MNITVSLSAVAGAVIGYLIFKNNPKVGGGYGALIGFFALPILIWAVTKPFGIEIK